MTAGRSHRPRLIVVTGRPGPLAKQAAVTPTAGTAELPFGTRAGRHVRAIASESARQLIDPSRLRAGAIGGLSVGESKHVMEMLYHMAPILPSEKPCYSWVYAAGHHQRYRRGRDTDRVPPTRAQRLQRYAWHPARQLGIGARRELSRGRRPAWIPPSAMLYTCRNTVPPRLGGICIAFAGAALLPAQPIQ